MFHTKSRDPPTGSQTVHETAPHVKSIMIAGPHGTGKRMLVNAICSELGANLIDLTAENICGRYPGKEEELFMLVLECLDTVKYLAYIW